MVVSWARAILSISKKAWTFPARPYYYISLFPKINRKPNNSKTEGRKGHTGPPGQPRGEELPCRFLSRPGGSLGPPGQPHVRKSCLAGSSLSSHDLVTDWVHPGGSRQLSMGSQRVRHVWATELSCTLPESKCEERSFGLPLEVRMCMANYAKCLERLLKFQRMNGPLEWGYIRRSVGPWSFHGGSEWPVLKGQGSIIEQRWGGVCSQVQKWEFVSFSVLILNYFYLTLQIHIFLPDLSLSENMTIYRIVL